MTFIRPGIMRTGARKIGAAPLSAKFGMTVIVLYVLAAIFAPQIAPYGEADIVGSQFEPWSSNFWLGTDNLGRDMFTRLIIRSAEHHWHSADDFSAGFLNRMRGWPDGRNLWRVD